MAFHKDPVINAHLNRSMAIFKLWFIMFGKATMEPDEEMGSWMARRGHKDFDKAVMSGMFNNISLPLESINE